MYPEDKSNWFLAQLKPNSHMIAQRNLARQGFEIFLPMQEVTRRAHGRFVTQLRPLFPGYIFVALNIAHGGWRAINATLGITRLVCLGNEPTPVPSAFVTELQMRCDSNGALQPQETYSKGDQVTLTKGPFAEIVATIESLEPDQRVYLLMDIMGMQTRVAVDAAHLRPLR
ncbi:MAG: transcriptional activator RfaH [Rhodobacteraceae bacterium]|nr:MAG: transcriptional activator RfaH [Paracoccaceae bacterium]